MSVGRGGALLVTGAAGFLGRALAADLRKTGVAVTGVDHRPRPRDWVGDWFATYGEALAAPAQHPYAAMVHMAWRGTSGAPDAGFDDAGFDNAGETLKAFRAAGSADLARFVFISSGGTVYGPGHSAAISEDTALRPVGRYGEDKARAETLVTDEAARSGPALLTLRLSNLYGPGQQPWRGQGLIATAVASALEDRKLQVWGDGTAVRDFLFIHDAARAVGELAFAATGEFVVNVGSGVPTRLGACLKEIERAVGRSLRVVEHPARMGDVDFSLLDVSRMRSVLGWVPATPLSSGLASTVDWMRQPC